MRQLLTCLIACLAIVAHAQDRPTPPTRAPDGPGAPKFKRIPSGGNAPVNANGNFVIGPDYPAPPELTLV